MGRERISNNHWISGALIVVLAAIVFFAPCYGWTIRAWLSPSVPDGAEGQHDPNAQSAATQADDRSLGAENDVLGARLAQLQVVVSQVPTSTSNEVRAMVYSRYPMNFRNELLVNAGAEEGVAQGAAVVFQGMLIGQVETVFPRSAVVETIFDNDLKMPVRIGATGANGLLSGGADPIVGSIARNAAIASGDIVYSAAPALPYAMPIARVVAISTSADSLFQQASLGFPYDVNSIETVLIVKQ